MGFSAKQVKALRRNLDPGYVRTRETNGRELFYVEGWYAITEANRIFGSMAGTGRLLNSAAYSLEKTVARSLLSISPGSGFRCMPVARPSFAKATDRAKAVGPPQVKSTIPRLRRQKPTPPNARWRPSETVRA